MLLCIFCKYNEVYKTIVTVFNFFFVFFKKSSFFVLYLFFKLIILSISKQNVN